MDNNVKQENIDFEELEKKQKWETVSKLWYKFSRNKLSVVGLVAIILIILAAVFAPYIAPYPEHGGAYTDFMNANKAPSSAYLLGTDIFGRDVLSRIIFALRGALSIGIVVLAISVPIGVTVGLIGGYFSGTWIETVVMRITDVFLGIPPLILALAIAAMLEPNLTNSMIAITVSWWPWYARLIYGMSSSLRNEPFIRAAELTGANLPHILFKEILPNCYGPIFTKMTLDMGWVILNAASLSFVGLGEQPPIPALGNMVSNGADYLPDYWWMAIFPALVIMIIILAFNLLGDGVRDMLAKEEG